MLLFVLIVTICIILGILISKNSNTKDNKIESHEIKGSLEAPHKTNEPTLVFYVNGDKAWWLNGELHREDGPAVEYANGEKYWRQNSKLHRTDGPAVEYPNGHKEWWLEGDEVTEEDVMGKPESILTTDSEGNKRWKNKQWLPHRTDGPAIECTDGYKAWYKNGKCHREDGPAIEKNGGFKAWYIDGARLTEKEFLSKTTSKSTMTIDKFGVKIWRNSKGKYHRTDGPAFEYPNGNKSWYINDKRHREDGPAVEYTDGYKAWYINGKRHRTDGPAREFNDGTKEWYLNDKKVTKQDVMGTKPIQAELTEETIQKWCDAFKKQGTSEISEECKVSVISLLENQRIHNELNNDLDPRFKRMSIVICVRVMEELRKKGIEIKSDLRKSAKAWKTNILMVDNIEDRFKPMCTTQLDKEAEWTLRITQSLVDFISSKKSHVDFLLLGFTLDNGCLVIYYDYK